MKKNFKTFYKTRKVADSLGNYHIVAVYGEMTENEMREGFSVAKVTTNKDGKILMKEPENITFFDFDDGNYGAKKSFNMGYAICDLRHDVYDKETAIKLAKKRFSKSPLTTRRGTFLTLDMINAIIDNEVNYICNHIDKYVKVKGNKNEIKKGDYIAITDKDGFTTYAKYKGTTDDVNYQVYWYGYNVENVRFFSEGTDLTINITDKKVKRVSSEEIFRANIF